MRRFGVLPGFGPTLGFVVTYLGLLVLIPLTALVVTAAGMEPHRLWRLFTDPRVLSAFRLSFGVAFCAAAVNAVFGTLVAWVLVRHPLALRGLVDALVDLPFALPTAVAGITLTSALLRDGVIGRLLGVQLAFTPVGIGLALMFVGLPFVVRSVQPAIEELRPEVEQSAQLLGATPFHTFRRVIFPRLVPSIATGFAIAFARGIGEYGSVVFVSGNMPFKTEIVPLLIVSRLEQYDMEAAAAIACGLLLISFLTLLSVNIFARHAAVGGH